MPMHAIASEVSHWMQAWFAPKAGARPAPAAMVDELRRAWCAERRYETLRHDSRARDAGRTGPGGAARQVFDEFYAQAPVAGAPRR